MSERARRRRVQGARVPPGEGKHQLRHARVRQSGRRGAQGVLCCALRVCCAVLVSVLSVLRCVRVSE